MQSNAWAVMAWSPVKATVSEFHGMLAAMRPVSASIVREVMDEGVAKGQALWGLETVAGRCGIAWDWTETRRVIALADPMTIISNIELVSERGHVLDANARLLHLNNAVHELAWQPAVRAAACKELALAA